jgi:FkbM family methyltransferase
LEISTKLYILSNSIFEGERLMLFQKLQASIVEKILRKAGLLDKYSPETVYDSILSSVSEGQVLIPVNEFEGTFYMDIRSHLLRRVILTKQYEPELVKIVKQYCDVEKDVIDTGANIGFFTVLFSRIISDKRKVLAIEPTPSAFNNLKLNINNNNVSKKVITFNGIATVKEGVYPISIIPGKEEYSTVGERPSHPLVQNYEFVTNNVPGNSIDNLAEMNKIEPGFIKIDVEGFEHSVIQGATKTLSKFRPVVLMELSDILLSKCGHSAEEVVLILEGLKYKVVDHEKMERPSFPFVGDILAIPQ